MYVVIMEFTVAKSYLQKFASLYSKTFTQVILEVESADVHHWEPGKLCIKGCCAGRLWLYALTLDK